MSGKIKRRDFMKMSLAGLATATLAMKKKTGPHKRGTGEISKHRWGMVIDLNTCIGCGECTLACRAHNDVPPDISWNRVIEVDRQDETTVYGTVACMHCEHAPCVDVCPVRATYHRPDGIVMMDYERCIGCRYCQMACPYGARSFNWQSFTGENPAVPEYGTPEIERRPHGVVEKCSFCYQRIDRGLELGLTPGVNREATPACVNVCPVGARLFGDLADPDSTISRVVANHMALRLYENKGTEPRVSYSPKQHEKKEDCAWTA